MSVMKPHPAYTSMVPVWTDIRNAFVGELAVKGALPLHRTGRADWTQPGMRYLPRPSGMRHVGQYEAYLSGASWLPATERAALGIKGSIFRHEPQIVAPPALDPHLADITQTGVSLRLFAEEVVLESLLMDRYGILVDYPGPVLTPDGQVQAPPPQSRPYWIGYPAEQIINWRTLQRYGDTILSLVVCKETVEEVKGPRGTPDFYLTEAKTQYRELSLNEAGVYEVKLWREDPTRRGQRPASEYLLGQWIPTRQGQPLDFIPFAFDPIIRKSLLEGLVRRNYLNFRHSADLEWARHLSCMPTLFVAANMEAPPEIYVGASQAVFLPDNQAKWGYAEPTGYGIPGMENAIKDDHHVLATLGARLLEGPPETAETATGVQWRMAGSDSPVQHLISVVNQRLTWALQVTGWWAGITDNLDDPALSMTLNKDLVSTLMEPQMLQALMTALLNGTISYETFWFNLQRGEIAPPHVTSEEEQALIEMQQAQLPLASLPQGPQPPRQNGQRPVAA